MTLEGLKDLLQNKINCSDTSLNSMASALACIREAIAEREELKNDIECFEAMKDGVTIRIGDMAAEREALKATVERCRELGEEWKNKEVEGWHLSKYAETVDMTRAEAYHECSEGLLEALDPPGEGEPKKTGEEVEFFHSCRQKSCDHCVSQEEGRHYCLLHGVAVKNMDIKCCAAWTPGEGE